MDVDELRQRLESDSGSLPLPPSLRSGLTIDYRKVDLALQWQETSELHHLLCPDSDCYPPLLKNISDPPPLLFVKGQPQALLVPAVAMVGSRAASYTGLQTARKLAADLASRGLAVVSGLAAGIDGACHQGCLSVGGVTHGILGTGIEQVYPKKHLGLYQDMQTKGCVVSELWPDVGVFAGNFPKRNRIVAGMALGTVVVEAARKSGSLISARLAMEEGREVFAVPGNILDERHQGCHDLLRQGAKLVCEAADIVEELDAMLRCQLDMLPQRPHIQAEIGQELPYPELLASVEYETTPLDRLVEHSGKPIDLVLEQILELELQGWVAAVPGGYVRIRRN
ncbi:DNA-processing protein DprA [Shewanella sp. 3B26]|uniref:DNA-processing protein DprA n=1 Tax=Shewanella zhuhaiensis TaxID=2919576 RepID=A0AAJ1BKI0_9GAMM|nr:DNA-processing protein DprA [Shewanella zhuhaiensis]MCH4296544.1 DNA-processing protein DprA [Shewanella zhuhaiensis]